MENYCVLMNTDFGTTSVHRIGSGEQITLEKSGKYVRVDEGSKLECDTISDVMMKDLADFYCLNT